VLAEQVVRVAFESPPPLTAAKVNQRIEQLAPRPGGQHVAVRRARRQRRQMREPAGAHPVLFAAEQVMQRGLKAAANNERRTRNRQIRLVGPRATSDPRELPRFARPQREHAATVAATAALVLAQASKQDGELVDIK
jgi:hypothetical protein